MLTVIMCINVCLCENGMLAKPRSWLGFPVNATKKCVSTYNLYLYQHSLPVTYI